MTFASLFRTNKENGYLTVEATFIMALVLPLIFFLVSWMFFSYNRCLLEQEIEILALRGAVWKGSKEKLADEINAQTKTLDQDKFVTIEKNKLSVKIKGNKLYLSQSATMPLWGGSLFKIGKKWEIKASCTNNRIDEVFFLRECRKVKQGKGK